MKAFIWLIYCVLAAFIAKVENILLEHEFRFSGARNVEFDWMLAKHMLGAQPSNVVISPFSVKILLTLLYEASGQGSDSRQELQAVLDPTGGLDATRTRYRSLLDSALTENADYDLQLSTKFFVDEFINVIRKYQGISDYYYNTTVDQVGFSNPQKAANDINSWVSQSTRGRINDIVTADGLVGAVITLISAIYLKGLWAFPFPLNGPRRVFYAGSEQFDVNYMEQNGMFVYDDSSVLDAQLLRMSFRGYKFAMYIILPRSTSSINGVLGRINSTNLDKALSYMDLTNVNVTIPKFQFEFSTELSQSLQEIGIQKIFSLNASLPLLARGKGARNQVKVSRIFQKVAVSVHEKGCEASVASDSLTDSRLSGEGTQIFNANRPFLFFIEDEHYGTLLFAGRVEEPKV